MPPTLKGRSGFGFASRSLPPSISSSLSARLSMPSSPVIPVAIIGAGPYGLSISANLRALGVEHRIFGRPMHSWLEHMPATMFLKSVGFASNLSDGAGTHTLGAFCAEDGRDYGHDDWPIPIGTFTDYGLWFQRALVPDVEPVDVVAARRAGDGFELELGTGERVTAAQLVLAIGHTYFPYTPDELAGLPRDLVSHAMDHKGFDGFSGRDVTVIGAGQSALESAALLHEAGANVRVLVRGTKLGWNPDPVAGPRTLAIRARSPKSGLGEGWKCFFYSNAPQAFYRLPYDTRVAVVKRALGPAGAWWLRPRVLGRFPVELGTVVRSAAQDGDGLKLEVAGPDGTVNVRTDHVLAGTGYRPDVDRISFLDAGLAAGIRRAGTAPVLTTGFESSVPGLYFVGLAAAQTFGPVQRFVFGADFTARRVSRRIAARSGARRRPAGGAGDRAASTSR
jgi:thioredoxin reductase